MKKDCTSVMMATFLGFMVCLCGVGNSVVFADEADAVSSEYSEILVENGYTEGTAEALPESEQEEVAEALLEDSDNVEVSTVTLEVDVLSEIEKLFSYSEEKLVGMGAELEEVRAVKEEFLEYLELEDEKLAEKLGIDTAQAIMVKQAITSGLQSNSDDETEEKTGISASGAISSSKLTYTQTVIGGITASKPTYVVKVSYTWQQVLSPTFFSDKIVIAWGGGLTTKNISSRAYYNMCSGGSYLSATYSSQEMEKSETAQTGIVFSFPQKVSTGTAVDAKAKTGYASFTLYQTKTQGYDTKVLSQYCHRVISVSSASISISSSGSSVSVSIGGAYNTSTQRSSTVSY